jgi:P27 family predicted phage terminase small subunit
MIRGNKRKPRELKVIEGTFRQDREVEHPPKLEDSLPLPPKRISPAALVIWNEIVPDLYAAGLLKRIDKNNIAVYCQFTEDFYAASEKVQLEGTTIVTTGGNVIENPQVSIMKRFAELMFKFGVEFGIGSAVMRSRIDIVKAGGRPADKQSDSKFGKFA